MNLKQPHKNMQPEKNIENKIILYLEQHLHLSV